MPVESLPIESINSQRRKTAQNMQHVIAAVVLISDAWSHLGHRVLLPALEIAAGATLIVTIIVERIRHARGASHSRVGWVEIAGAGMLYAEAVNRLFEPHTVALRIVSFFNATLILLMGIFDLRLRQLPQIRADDDKFMMRTRFVRRKSVKWSDVRSAHADGENVYVERNDGRTKRFTMRKLKNRDAAIEWTMDQFRKRGLM